MHRLMRFYNQHRKEVWRIVGIIAFAIILLQMLNWWAKRSNESELINANISDNTNTSSSDPVQITSSKSTVTGGNISKENLSSQTEIIKQFLDNCNNSKTEEAYNMLTEECKEEMYSSLSDFKVYYCGNYFKDPRASFEIENWFGNTYKINIVPDMLATGKTNNGYVNQDYITLVRVDGKYKLNINSYIGRTIKSKETSSNGIYIKINYKDIYMDYEKYNMTVKNENKKNIFLDSKEELKTMYLVDKNDVKYPAIINEIPNADLKFIAEEEKTINIKYYSKYTTSKTMSKLVFSRAILDSDKYTNIGEKEDVIISINI